MNDDVDERALVVRAGAGDRRSFAALHASHADGVRGFLFHLGVRPHDLDDAEQEVFLVALSGLSTFAARSSFRTWLYGIAVNVARGAARKRGPVSEAPDLPIEHSPAEDAQRRELASTLAREIARLPDALREAFVLHHVEAWPAKDSSRALGIPEGTLRRRAFEARALLSARLTRDGVNR